MCSQGTRTPSRLLSTSGRNSRLLAENRANEKLPNAGPNLVLCDVICVSGLGERRGTQITTLFNRYFRSEFVGKLPHRQASQVSIANLYAKFFEKTSDNVFKARPLGVEILWMEPDVENPAVSAHAFQSLSEPPQTARVGYVLAPAGLASN